MSKNYHREVLRTARVTQLVLHAVPTDEVGNLTALPGLLDQVDSPFDLFLADGAYDGDPTSDLLVARFGSTIEVTIPPPKNAVLGPNAAQDPTVRDRHIATSQSAGGWAGRGLPATISTAGLKP
jgi:hypothetical protein